MNPGDAMNRLAFASGQPATLTRWIHRVRLLAVFMLGVPVLCFAIVQPGIQATSGQQFFEQGEGLAREGRLAESEVALDKAAQLLPEDRQVLALLGKVKSRLGEFPEAIKLLQRVVDIDPKSADAHVDLAIAHSDSGNLRLALDETRKAIELAPNLPSAHLNRARILDDLKREAEAENEFAIAAMLAPDDPAVYFYWSFVERANGNFSKETSLLRSVVELQPTNGKAFILLAKSLMEQSKNTQAEAALRRALTIDPESTDATYLLSRVLVKSNPAESKRLADRFSELRKHNAEVVRSKNIGNEAFGATLEKDWMRAVKLYREALQVCGDCEAEEALHRNLGLTLCKSGDVTEGELELRKAIAMNPDDREAAQAIEFLSHKDRN